MFSLTAPLEHSSRARPADTGHSLIFIVPLDVCAEGQPLCSWATKYIPDDWRYRCRECFWWALSLEPPFRALRRIDFALPRLVASSVLLWQLHIIYADRGSSCCCTDPRGRPASSPPSMPRPRASSRRLAAQRGPRSAAWLRSVAAVVAARHCGAARRPPRLLWRCGRAAAALRVLGRAV